MLHLGVFAGLGMINVNGMGNESAHAASLDFGMFRNLSSSCVFFENILHGAICLSHGHRRTATAAAFLIIANQSKHVLGLSGQGEGTASTFWGILSHTSDNIAQSSAPSIWLGLITAVVFMFLQMWMRTLPNAALTLIVSSLVGILFEHFQWKVSYLDSFESTQSFLVIPSLQAFGSHWETILWSASAVSLFMLAGRAVHWEIACCPSR